MAKSKKTAHCAWCGKDVPVSDKGLLMPHRTPGNQNCVGAGQPARQSEALSAPRKPR